MVARLVTHPTLSKPDRRCPPIRGAGADAANRFGQIASVLAASGTPFGQIDTLIAAHALAFDVTLVTNNDRHFGRVRGLRTESWR